ncbi:MAG: CysB family HTH-type transcriptional regulator [Aquabacterium sp.]|uniref:CysB family HTH-type transcriptional regulator n=1 Tax=Aquabacterium sp. TaxID=1872578 RepID=UPI0025BC9E26|nr:CysB family HTH-type transcriptional regulator [Aquabacterium sp.]MBI5926685.1 CysB family HTH-type transcriptional regulator [Aquabacterium sp.]
MNLHQFRFVYEAARRNLNLTETAKALHTSQPGISKAIMELEEELGVDIFVRHGKRLKRVTEPGQQVLQSIDIILRELGNLRRIGDEYAMQDAGTLSIATTHTQARYVLPEPVAALRKKFPKVSVSLHQGTPEQVAQMVLDETADIGLATESLSDFPDLVTLPCYEWQHVVVMPATHPLTQVPRLTLEQLAAEPLISYHPSFTGRKRIDQAFAQRGLTPNVVLEAIDADVIKTYTRLGLGIGLVAEMAVKDDPMMSTPGSELVWRPVGHLFGPNMARLAFKRGAYLRQFVLSFAELISDRLTRALIMQAMQSHHKQQGDGDYGL